MIAIIIITALVLILGVSGAVVIKAMLLIMALVLLAMLDFFTVIFFIMLKSKKTEATLCRFESFKNGRFERAVYLANGEEYLNIFPAEQIMRSRIYRNESCKIRTVRFAGRNYAVDRHTVLIILCGCTLSLMSLALLIFTSVLTGGIL